MRKVLALTFAIAASMIPHAAHAEATTAERAACQADAFRLCTHAIPDRDQVRQCLRENMRRLNPTCRGAIQRSRK